MNWPLIFKLLQKMKECLILYDVNKFILHLINILYNFINEEEQTLIKIDI